VARRRIKQIRIGETDDATSCGGPARGCVVVLRLAPEDSRE
jgi:hypothetical protein